jgi:prepilin-type N-terminal cleavage/methylation domain-containing protein
MKRSSQKGMTLVEVLVAIGIVAVILAMATTMLSTTMRGTQDNVNKQFATQKAMSMLEELRALIQTQSGATTVVLDDYDDGTTNRPVLTTQRSVTRPDAPESGNTRIGSNWLFERRVTVQRVRGANDLRIVNVKVFVREASGPRLLAEVAGVLSTIGQSMPPTQVYDVYLIAIENVPGWWLYMDSVLPFVENAMQDLEARHPGLQFRKHWIRTLSYGRDAHYKPYVNATLDSTADVDHVYFYPGRLPAGSPVENYYPHDALAGQMLLDNTPANDTHPDSYAFADQYNHAMRYPEEKALFERRVAAGLQDADTPTLRLLLDGMVLEPEKYRNAIVINLHGEMFPFPPVRNYADAAKDPDTRPYARVVTHPERIAYGSGDDLKLRVHAYHTNSPSPGTVPDKLTVPISVVLKNVQWSPLGAGPVVAVLGGIDLDGNGSPDPYSRITASTFSSATTMWWTSQIVGSDTVLRLYNTPLKSPCVPNPDCSSSGGLSATRRLYGLEYIPAPVENLPASSTPAAFATDLATQGAGVKNTARWVITIPSAVLPADNTVEVETRIGDDLTTGTRANLPSNLSRTYVWRGSDTWKFGNAANNPHMPLSERFQILGDPRHCPYADLKLAHAGAPDVNNDPLGMGYNRYFDDFHAGTNALAAWPGWSYRSPLGGTPYGIKNNSSDTTSNNDGWDTRSGYLEIDVPRIYQILRTAVVRSHAVYTTMTGFSYYYVGLGGEIGYDASNGFNDSIPVSSKPFTGSGGTRWEQSITDASIFGNGGGVKVIRENSAGDFWWSMSWLGELAPDSSWARWRSTGNLATGSGSGTFSRVLRSSINTRLPAGTQFINTVRRTQEEGSTAFFWSGSASSTFHHRYEDNTTGDLASPAGTAIANTYKLPLPANISNSRPFATNVNDTAMNPDHFLQAPYGAASTLQSLAEFYRHSTNIHGSALLATRNGNDAAFVMVNGLSPTGQAGVAFVSRWSFLSLIQSFLTAGLYTTAGNPDPSRVHELPRIVITTPNDNIDLNDPQTVAVGWDSQWRRWDGLPYTPAYPAGWAETTTVRFALLYSRDNGRTWLFMRDDSPATPGVRPAAAYLQTTTTYSWSTPPAQFPKGNYLIRIEAYRDGIPLHYSFHQYRAFFKR